MVGASLGGAYADASVLLVPAAMVRSLGPYRFPAAWLDSYGVNTNLPPAAAFRGAMSSQTTWAYESQMDIIARRLGWDALEFRLKNLPQDGDEFSTGEIMHDVHFVDCLRAVAEELEHRRAEAPIPIAKAGPRAGQESVRRGVGYAVTMKSTIATSRSQCRLVLDDRGAVSLVTSTVEMGQDSHTALAQMVSTVLEVPVSWGRVVGPDTAITPFDSTTSASRSTGAMGSAIGDAADKLKGKLLDLAAQRFELEPEALTVRQGGVEARAGDERITYSDLLRYHGLGSLESVGTYATKLGIDPETGQGISTPHWHQGAGAAEVEVDLETGKVTVLRYCASSFAGRVVNPRLTKLQNDGNVIFGLGPALLEEVIFDGGQITNPNLSDYMIPSMRDIPLQLHSVVLESESGEIHGIGEMALPPVAPAIGNAIPDAVGVRIKDLPLSAERVLRALKEQSA